jgi:hypothetical protein
VASVNYKLASLNTICTPKKNNNLLGFVWAASECIKNATAILNPACHVLI